MTLNAEQIERLYAFTREHFVEWYDLQSEFVDHLANAIEQQWEQQPELEFETALQAEFKKFGVFGFMEIVEQRQAALTRKYHGILWKHFRTFFGIPNILLTIAMVYALFLILKQLPYAEEWYMFISAVLLLSMLLLIVRKIVIQNKTKRTTEKRWLFNDIIHSYGNLSVVMLFPIQVLIRLSSGESKFLSDDGTLLIASILLVIYALAAFVILRVIPAKAASYLAETYPDYVPKQL